MAEDVLERLLIDVKTVGVALAGGELERLSGHVKKSDETAQKATKSHLGLGRAFGGLKGMAATAGGAVGASGLAAAFGESIKNAMGMQTAQAQLANSIHNNVRRPAEGATEHLTSFADALSLQGGYAPMQAVEGMSKFVRVTGDVTKAERDMNLATNVSRGMHMDLSRAVRAVMMVEAGRTTGLGRMGIVLPKVTTAQDKLKESHVKATVAQKEAAKAADALASKQTALATLQRRFGGAAAAYGRTAAGAMSNFRNAVDVLMTRLGSFLLPVLTSIANALSKFVKGMLDGQGTGGKFVAIIKTIIHELVSLWGWVKANSSALEIVGGTILGVVAAMRAMMIINALVTAWRLYRSGALAAAAAQWIVNAAMAANPVGIIVIAIGALIGALVVAYLKIRPFREAVNAVFGAIKSGFVWLKNAVAAVVNWVLHHWRLLILAIGPLGFAIDVVSKHFNFFKGIALDVFNFVYGKAKWVVGVVTSIWTTLTNALSKPFNTAKGIIQTALDGVLSAVRWIVSRVESLLKRITGPIGAVASKIGGVIHTITHGPAGLFHKLTGAQGGGMVTGGGPFLVGERGPEIVTLPRGGYVTPNHELGHQGRGDRPIVLYNILDGKVMSKSVIRQGLLQAARS